jgi:hypothetical protein
MSLKINAAAIRVYDAMKARPGAQPRASDARDPAALEAIQGRLNELVSSYRVGGHSGAGGATYVFWSEVYREVSVGAFDDLLDRL